MEGEPDVKGEIVLTVGSPFPHSGDLGLADAGAEDATLVAQGFAALTALARPTGRRRPGALGPTGRRSGGGVVGLFVHGLMGDSTRVGSGRVGDWRRELREDRSDE